MKATITKKHWGIFLFFITLSYFGVSQNISTLQPTQNYSVGSTAVVVAPGLTITGGTGTINAATVSIQSFQPGDILHWMDITGIAYVWVDATKTMSFTGSASNADYQALLRSIAFETTTSTAGSRQIDFLLGTGVSFVINGKEHIYEVKGSSGVNISWTAARAAARVSEYDTLRGYLATITSAEENAFIASKVTKDTWIGASDDPGITGGSALQWYWISGGPEGPRYFFNQTGTGGGTAIGGYYNNWASGEPNNYNSLESWAHMYADGSWNDFPDNNSVDYYLVEYGGFDSSPTTLGNSDYATINVFTNQPPVANNDAYNIYENTTRSIPASGVLANDTDADNDPITVNPTAGISVSHGTVSVSSNGAFSYTPTINYTGTDSFSYTCWDGTTGDNATCSLYVMTPLYTGTGSFTVAGNWNGGYVPPNIDNDLEIIIAGTLTTTSTIDVQSMIVNGIINIYHNITVDYLTIHTNATMNFFNGATVTVNNSVSNETRTGLNISSPVILHSGFKIN